MNFDISSTLLEKMWDTLVNKGIPAFLRPWQMKRENKARLECIRNEKLEMIKIENEAKRLQLSLDKELFTETEIVPQIEQIVSEVANTKLHEIVKEEISVTKAIEYAGDYIQEEKLVEEKPSELPSDDWLNKWKKRTQEFMDEDALKLWGKVLAGEFASPGKYSYKFLDWMSSITPKDAQLISKLMENVFADVYYCGMVGNRDLPLTYDDLLMLQELGVIQGVESIGLGKTYKSSNNELFQKAFLSANNKHMLLIEHIDCSRELKLTNICCLTRIGKEVKQLCDVSVNYDYVQKLGKYIADQGFDVSYADVISIVNGQIHYSALSKLEFNSSAN